MLVNMYTNIHDFLGYFLDISIGHLSTQTPTRAKLSLVLHLGGSDGIPPTLTRQCGHDHTTGLHLQGKFNCFNVTFLLINKANIVH